MKKCKHLRPWGYRRFVIVDGEIKHMLFCKCDCGHWLPLGPSDETDPRVAVEIRAARLAAIWNSNSSQWNGFESLGMVSPEAQHAPLIERDIFEGRKWQRDLDDYYAGHLARCILDHDSATEREGRR